MLKSFANSVLSADTQQKKKKQILFTPGPVMTSDAVRAAMTTDYGSRDAVFLRAVSELRTGLMEAVHLDPKQWGCVLQQGPGTMGIEGAIDTLLPRTGGKYLLLNNGKYAERQRAVVKRLGRAPLLELTSGEGEDIDFVRFEQLLQEHSDITTVGYVHHETSTGFIYPAERITATVRRFLPNASVFCDAISSFASVPFEVPEAGDIVVTSANKGLHSVPGFSILFCRRAVLAKCRGHAVSYMLDLTAQLAGFDKNGQFIATPPVHTLMAGHAALKEFQREGGIAGRIKSYEAKRAIVVKAAKEMGFTLLLDDTRPTFGRVVVALMMPHHEPKWSFKTFYTYLNDRGYVIYPGKASHAEAFRIGLIGATTVDDMKAIMACAKEALRSMGIETLSPPPQKSSPKAKL